MTGIGIGGKLAGAAGGAAGSSSMKETGVATSWRGGSGLGLGRDC
jgi:hypothetical protein